jgi:hypothetical protein
MQLTMRDPIHATEYVHADIPNTNTRACLARIPTFISVRNATVHTMHKRASTTTHSCEQAMCCAHYSVWSVELWASAAAMCCASFAPMELLSRLYAHVRMRRTMQHTCVTHDAKPHTRSCTHACTLQEVLQLDVLLRLMKKLHKIVCDLAPS